MERCDCRLPSTHSVPLLPDDYSREQHDCMMSRKVRMSLRNPSEHTAEEDQGIELPRTIRTPLEGTHRKCTCK